MGDAALASQLLGLQAYATLTRWFLFTVLELCFSVVSEDQVLR